MIVGVNQLNLVIFHLAHPDSKLEEMAIYLFNEGAASLPSLSIMPRHLKELEVSKKNASIEACEALVPDVSWK